MVSVPSDVICAMHCIAAAGIPQDMIALSGGACRDMLHNVVPRDWDIVITGPVTEGQHARIGNMLSVAGWNLQSTHANYDTSNNNSDFEKRWKTVIQYDRWETATQYEQSSQEAGSRFPINLSIDLLFATSYYLTPLQSVLHYDCNLNMCMISMAGIRTNSKPIYVGGLIGYPWGEYHQSRNASASAERKYRMMHLAKDYRWNINQAEFEQLFNQVFKGE